MKNILFIILLFVTQVSFGQAPDPDANTINLSCGIGGGSSNNSGDLVDNGDSTYTWTNSQGSFIIDNKNGYFTPTTDSTFSWVNSNGDTLFSFQPCLGCGLGGSTGSVTVNNGLRYFGDDIELGGDLVRNTDINLQDYNLRFIDPSNPENLEVYFDSDNFRTEIDRNGDITTLFNQDSSGLSLGIIDDDFTLNRYVTPPFISMDVSDGLQIDGAVTFDGSTKEISDIFYEIPILDTIIDLSPSQYEYNQIFRLDATRFSNPQITELRFDNRTTDDVVSHEIYGYNTRKLVNDGVEPITLVASTFSGRPGHFAPGEDYILYPGKYVEVWHDAEDYWHIGGTELKIDPITVNNGLRYFGDDIELGGDLIRNTAINLLDEDFVIIGPPRGTNVGDGGDMVTRWSNNFFNRGVDLDENIRVSFSHNVAGISMGFVDDGNSIIPGSELPFFKVTLSGIESYGSQIHHNGKSETGFSSVIDVAQDDVRITVPNVEFTYKQTFLINPLTADSRIIELNNENEINTAGAGYQYKKRRIINVGEHPITFVGTTVSGQIDQFAPGKDVILYPGKSVEVWHSGDYWYITGGEVESDVVYRPGQTVLGTFQSDEFELRSNNFCKNQNTSGAAINGGTTIHSIENCGDGWIGTLQNLSFTENIILKADSPQGTGIRWAQGIDYILPPGRIVMYRINLSRGTAHIFDN